MTLRRYAPLALAGVAFACKPSIESRPNASTTEYAAFDPAGTTVNPPNPVIAIPNDIAINQFLAKDPGPSALPCNLVPGGATSVALCAYARAGGFPASAVYSTAAIEFVRGTLESSGAITYGVSPDAMDPATLAFAAASAAPTLGILDLTSSTPVTNATPAFNATSGALTLTPSGAAWTAGHKYAVLVLGNARGPKTLGGAPYTAMPAFYVLRESVIADLDLTLPQNQGLFPGTDAEKAAAGAALEPLRIAYRMFYDLVNPSLVALNVPFEDVISLQTFQIAPAATLTIGDGATEPSNATITHGTTTPAALDTFTLQTGTAAVVATLTAVSANLSASTVRPASVFLHTASDCTSGTTLGTNSSPTADPVTILATNYLSATPTSTTLYLCVTPPSAGTGTISGTVAGVGQFPGLAFTPTDSDTTSATLTVN